MGGASESGAAARRSLALRAIYALCLSGATCVHAAVIVKHGPFWDHYGLPRASTLFWTALVVIDPAAIVLLFARPNAGVALTVAIIVVDVIHNVWIQAHYFPPLLAALADAPQVIAQIVFMAFVVVTARHARVGRRDADAAL